MLDVKVKIDLTRPAGILGFGYPLIVSAIELTPGVGETNLPATHYTVCSSLDDVAAAEIGTETILYKTVALLLSQNNAPEKFAIAVIEEITEEHLSSVIGEDWRQLIIAEKTENLSLKDIATYIETTDKVFFTSVANDGEEANLKGKDRTVVVYYEGDADGACPEAALVGATAGLDVGSFTYKNIILKGLDPLELSDAEIAEFTNNNVITVVEKAGDIVTTEGKSMNGEYIDIIDSKDYIVQQITYRTQKLLNQSAKIPYDNNGIAMLESVVVDVLQDCFNKGMIAVKEDGAPAYSVEFALREDSDAADIAARKYLGGQFTFTLAGAIHEVEITGEITL